MEAEQEVIIAERSWQIYFIINLFQSKSYHFRPFNSDHSILIKRGAPWLPATGRNALPFNKDQERLENQNL